jgi:alpha-D-ribose 1-methylphosphonate 5-triphosphate diphosphatase
MKYFQCITNTNIVTEDGILEDHAVILENDRIKSIIPMSMLNDTLSNYYCGMQYHDGSGSFVTPGFIDIHSDNLETVIQPRPTSAMNFEMAIMEQEKMLVNEGVTTMYHSLSFLRKEGSAMREKESRKPHRMKELVKLIQCIQDSNHLIRHRFHCRFDVRNSEGYDTLMDYLEKDYIHLLSFNDHTPGQGQYRDLVKYRENLKNYKPDIPENEIDRLIAERMAVPKISAELLTKTAEIAREKGIPIASHDDDSIEKLEYVCNVLKSSISEFPVELEIARRAKDKGMYTIAGAPNVLLGKSHSGNMSASEAILAGCIDILCSDYYPPALLHAVYKLNREYSIPLWKAINFVTLNPAKALGIDHDFGSVAEGKKADILMIKILDKKPVITKVFIDGKLVSELNYRRVEYA